MMSDCQWWLVCIDSVFSDKMFLLWSTRVRLIWFDLGHDPCWCAINVIRLTWFISLSLQRAHWCSGSYWQFLDMRIWSDFSLSLNVFYRSGIGTAWFCFIFVSTKMPLSWLGSSFRLCMCAIFLVFFNLLNFTARSVPILTPAADIYSGDHAYIVALLISMYTYPHSYVTQFG